MTKLAVKSDGEDLDAPVVRIGHENDGRIFFHQRGDAPRRIEFVGTSASSTSARRTKHQLRGEEQKLRFLLLTNEQRAIAFAQTTNRSWPMDFRRVRGDQFRFSREDKNQIRSSRFSTFSSLAFLPARRRKSFDENRPNVRDLGACVRREVRFSAPVGRAVDSRVLRKAFSSIFDSRRKSVVLLRVDATANGKDVSIVPRRRRTSAG